MAASALLVDYVLIVAVSVTARADAITSAFLTLRPAAVAISLGLVALLAVTNLRGVKESGTIFAIPTPPDERPSRRLAGSRCDGPRHGG